MRGADSTDLHDADADGRIETMDTDWDSVASAVTLYFGYTEVEDELTRNLPTT